MIFGITLKNFAKLKALGDKAPNSKRIVRLLLKQSSKRFRTRNIEDIKFSDYVDLEKYFESEDYSKFCHIFVKKYFWQKVYVHNMPLIIEDFSKQRIELYEKYYYIFDPPQYGIPAEETPGDQIRKEFVEEFGNWVVLTDRVCKGHMIDYKTVEKWKLGEFLFWANYLTGQRIVEAVK